jgi:hypothetical protein
LKQEVTEPGKVLRLAGGLFTGVMLLGCLLCAALIWVAPRYQPSRIALLLAIPLSLLNIHIWLMYSVRRNCGIAASAGWLIAASLGVSMVWFLATIPFAYGYAFGFVGADSVPIEYAKEELLFHRTLDLPFYSYLAFPQFEGQLRTVPGLDLWLLPAFLALSGGAMFLLMRYGLKTVAVFAALLSAALLSIGASALAPGLADLVPQARGIPLYQDMTLTDVDNYWSDTWHKVSFVTDGPPGEMLTYYKEALPAIGWSFSTVLSRPDYLVFYSEGSEGVIPWNREVIVQSFGPTGTIVLQRVPNVRKFPVYEAESEVENKEVSSSDGFVGVKKTYLTALEPQEVTHYYATILDSMAFWIAASRADADVATPTQPEQRSNGMANVAFHYYRGGFQHYGTTTNPHLQHQPWVTEQAGMYDVIVEVMVSAERDGSGRTQVVIDATGPLMP